MGWMCYLQDPGQFKNKTLPIKGGSLTKYQLTEVTIPKVCKAMVQRSKTTQRWYEAWSCQLYILLCYSSNLCHVDLLNSLQTLAIVHLTGVVKVKVMWKLNSIKLE